MLSHHKNALFSAIKNANITQTPLLDAKLLAEHLNTKHLNADHLDAEQEHAFRHVLARYLKHEPVSRIVEKRHFWEGQFRITKHTFDPRPETETLVEQALTAFPQNCPLTILDWGTGSGCVLISVLGCYPKAFGIGIERCFDASLVASHNAYSNDVGERICVLNACSTEGLRSGCVDLFLSNPPYIPSYEIENLEPCVRLFDPRDALDGGEDGLCVYRLIIPEARRVLKKGGVMILEIGSTQGTSVRALLEAHSFKNIVLHHDLSGLPRCLMAEC